MSRRLGEPKQLLPYKGKPLLQAAVDCALRAGFDRVVVALGHAATEVRAAVDLDGCDVVQNPTASQGCSGSISAGVSALSEQTEGVVLILGDQPEIAVDAMHQVRSAGHGGAVIAVARYENGIGHPFWFERSLFPNLLALSGDKAAWKLVESGDWPVTEVPIDGPIPADIDTWDDYERLVGDTA